ncbi:hypothetical protein E2562_036242 [Oryza meyeriana var. granulata]|uniref:DUF630 domain-containing protein n=1 Tax=Oryza meyeriana var. granulata TaxID=110450 RepID=A0A6G1ETC4_9ORYZ|nr:hypothetical protein E2562_036242 [Oryza meyeriana var. granulata]
MERPPREEESGGVVARYSLDVSEGCGGRHSALLDEYERMAFEAQLNRAILRRCYSEPSPARFPVVVQPAGALLLPPPRGAEGDGGCTAPWRFCRLHEAVFRWLEAVKPVLCWLRSAWERRRMERAAAAATRGPPTTVPRVQLMDYLC